MLEAPLHKGLYKFLRFPFGVKFALSIFQQVMDTMLNSLDFAVAYLDDLLMKSESIEEHKLYIWQVFRRIQDYGFKLKDGKCEIFLERIKYLGQISDKDGNSNKEYANTRKCVDSSKFFRFCQLLQHFCTKNAQFESSTETD